MDGAVGGRLAVTHLIVFSIFTGLNRTIPQDEMPPGYV
jgi:hypothetical protein